MEPDHQKLDNPVWHALSETHKRFAIVNGGAKFYQPDYCLFGAFERSGQIAEPPREYAMETDNFFIVGGDRPPFGNLLRLKNELLCHQMIWKRDFAVDIRENVIKLGEEHAGVLSDLVNLVQPGYFRRNTGSLGSYYGIFKHNQLVAVAGERMKMDHFTEISAVVTHPDHTGSGYAHQVTAQCVNCILEENKLPFLHVAATNTRAIGVYESLGFQKRTEISFWHLIKKQK